MQEPPKQGYRVVERDGRLVVEPDAASKPRLLPRLSIPRVRLPVELIRKGGRELFAWKCNPELDAHGNAIVYASNLEALIQLDARSSDQYYVTERQQVLFGYLLCGGWVLIPLVVLAFVLVQMYGPVLFVLFFVLATLIAVYGRSLWAEVQAIHGQQYFSEDWITAEDRPVQDAPPA